MAVPKDVAMQVQGGAGGFACVHAFQSVAEIWGMS